MPKRIHFQYFAGYIDGDGHFKLASYQQESYTCYHSKIMITSTKQEPLIFFKSKFGGAISKKSFTRKNCSDEYLWTFHLSKRVRDEMKPLQEFLIEKRSQFDDIINFFTVPVHQRQKQIDEFRAKRKGKEIVYEEIARIKNCSSDMHTFIPAYIAGYIDAEGSLTISRKKLASGNYSYSTHLRVSSTNSLVIEYLFNCMGGCISFRNPNKANHRPYLSYELTNASLDKFLPQIIPHLINKKTVAKTIQRLRETFHCPYGYRSVEFSNHLSRVSPIREQCFLWAKEHNKRGS